MACAYNRTDVEFLGHRSRPVHVLAMFSYAMFAWPVAAAIAAPISVYHAGHLRPAWARPLMPAWARPAGAGVGRQGGGRPPMNIDGGGANIYIGPPHI